VNFTLKVGSADVEFWFLILFTSNGLANSRSFHLFVHAAKLHATLLFKETSTLKLVHKQF
jgi:hypothetical protein